MATLGALSIWVALALGATMTPAAAQTAAPDRAGETWTQQQRGQSWASAKLAASPRQHEWVALRLKDRTLRAFVVYPRTAGQVPVVIVPHEVFGLTDSTRNTADEIAAMGYLAIAPDILSGMAPDGGGTSSMPSVRMAGDVTTSLTDAVVDAQLDAWADWGLRRPVANGKLVIVGVSWGGGAGFRYAAARHDPRLKAVCVFYDVGPPTRTQGPDRMAPNPPPLSVSAIDVPIYGFYPSGDTRVMQSLDATRQAMAAAGKRFDVVVYQGADHAYMRVGEDPADDNPANAAAVTASLARLRVILGRP